LVTPFIVTYVSSGAWQLALLIIIQFLLVLMNIISNPYPREGCRKSANWLNAFYLSQLSLLSAFATTLFSDLVTSIFALVLILLYSLALLTCFCMILYKVIGRVVLGGRTKSMRKLEIEHDKDIEEYEKRLEYIKEQRLEMGCEDTFERVMAGLPEDMTLPPNKKDRQGFGKSSVVKTSKRWTEQVRKWTIRKSRPSSLSSTSRCGYIGESRCRSGHWDQKQSSCDQESAGDQKKGGWALKGKRKNRHKKKKCRSPKE
jgi:hypothetical protein